MLPAVLLAWAMQPDPAMLRRLFEEALAHRRHEYGASDIRTAQAARDLGLFLARQNDLPDAQTALAEALRIDESAIGVAAAQTLKDAAELAAVSVPSQAEALWLRASAAADPGMAARALGSLGDLRKALGDRADAADFYRKAVAKQEAASGRNSEAVAVRLNALAQAVEPKDAIPLLERALAIDRQALGPRNPQTATTEANLAGILVHVQRNDEAIRAAGEALAIFQETLGPDHPRCAVTASMLAFALEAKGDKAQAEKMYRLAAAVDERAYGPSHPQTLNDLRELAEFLKTIGKARDAAEIEKRIR